jgi:3-oxoacid CoA-transferase subunit B
MVPGSMVNGMGAAMDLVRGAARVIMLTEHTDRESNQRSSTAALALTGRSEVNWTTTTPTGHRSRRRRKLALLELVLE